MSAYPKLTIKQKQQIEQDIRNELKDANYLAIQFFANGDIHVFVEHSNPDFLKPFAQSKSAKASSYASAWITGSEEVALYSQSVMYPFDAQPASETTTSEVETTEVTEQPALESVEDVTITTVDGFKVGDRVYVQRDNELATIVEIKNRIGLPIAIQFEDGGIGYHSSRGLISKTDYELDRQLDRANELKIDVHTLRVIEALEAKIATLERTIASITSDEYGSIARRLSEVENVIDWSKA